jgi:hypothetical protein
MGMYQHINRYLDFCWFFSHLKLLNGLICLMKGYFLACSIFKVVLELKENGTVATCDDPPVALGSMPRQFLEQVPL